MASNQNYKNYKSTRINKHLYETLALINQEHRDKSKTVISAIGTWIENDIIIPFLEIQKATGYSMRDIQNVVLSDIKAKSEEIAERSM